MKWFHSFGIAALSLTLAGAADAGGRWHVDAGAKGSTETGLSWRNAFRNLQSALEVAQSGDEILVAEGVYYPSRELEPGEARSRTFQLVDGVHLYGGFPSGLACNNARDPMMYETVLSGDFNVDDEIVFMAPAPETTEFYNFEDNAWHVVVGASTVLDGFTVTGGNAEGSRLSPDETRWGGGLLNIGNDLVVRNTMFHGNLARYGGGGVYNLDATIAFENCCFYRNFGVYDLVREPVGGAISSESSVIDIRDSEFFQNAVVNRGATIGCGGAIAGGELTIARTCFGQNAAYIGGAIHTHLAGMTLTDCSFVDNRAVPDGFGGAVDGRDVLAHRCDFLGNDADEGAGALSVRGTSTLVHCRFIDNYGDFAAGAVLNTGTLVLAGCLFDGNEVLTPFAGVSLHNSGHAFLINCTIADSDDINPAVYNETGTIFVRNNVLWPRRNSDAFGGDLTGIDVEYSIVRGGFPGAGNLDLDPLFVDEDLRLGRRSPAIDAGDTSYVRGILRATMADLDGNFRLVDDPLTPDTGVPVGREPIVDIGAYEFQGAR